MVSLLLCLLDWCMAVPLSLLLEPITAPPSDGHASGDAPLLDYIYRVGLAHKAGKYGGRQGPNATRLLDAPSLAKTAVGIERIPGHKHESEHSTLRGSWCKLKLHLALHHQM